MSRWTCPSCGIGEMMPEKFSNYYVCDFCGNRIYQSSGYAGHRPTASEISNAVRGPVDRALKDVDQAVHNVNRTSNAYIASKKTRTANKSTAKEKKGSFLGKVVGVIFVLWLLSHFMG